MGSFTDSASTVVRYIVIPAKEGSLLHTQPWPARDVLTASWDFGAPMRISLSRGVLAARATHSVLPNLAAYGLPNLYRTHLVGENPNAFRIACPPTQSKDL